MVFASALAAVAVTLGTAAVYCAAGAALALGRPDVATAAAAVELPVESVAPAVQSPLRAAEPQVSAAAVVSGMVAELAGSLG